MTHFSSMKPLRPLRAGLALLALALLALAPDAQAQTYTISTVAGTGSQGFGGDGGPATAAQLNSPYSTAVDGSGNVFIADLLNNRIRRVDAATGLISTVAGDGTQGFGGDGGPATSARLFYPAGVAVDGGGNVFIADYVNGRIRRVDAVTGLIATVAGDGTGGYSGDGGPATSAKISAPTGVAVDGGGNVFLADRGNHRIRRVDAATGLIATVAGDGTAGYSGDGGPATAAQLNNSFSMTVDGSGNLYIADTDNQRIRRVDAATGLIATVAGDGTQDFGGDGGPATSAKISGPTGVAVDGGGNVLIADFLNNRIRRVDAATGLISTVAGDGTQGFGGDGGPATSAQLFYPAGVTVASNGHVFLAEQDGHRVRRLTPEGGPNLTISDTRPIAAGTYGNITITGTGDATLAGDISVSGTFEVQAGGTLRDECFGISGPGSFVLQGGATFDICNAEGLVASADAGAVRLAGAKYSDDAIYTYSYAENGQATGNALPATVRELNYVPRPRAGEVVGLPALVLAQNVRVRRRVEAQGPIALAGSSLTLLSDATGTALVTETPSLVQELAGPNVSNLLGGTGVMQRYIGTNTDQNGYRHYSSPVQDAPLSTLAAGSYVPDFGGAVAYNSSATPGLVTPFPTVFAYNQDRIPATTSTYTNFDKGFEAPLSGEALMGVGRGYAVQAPGSILVDFEGQFTTGDVTRSDLNRSLNAQGTDVGMGWHLLGNPYPAPIDWRTLSIGSGDSDNLQGLNAAVYVVQSSGPYTGTYRTYLAEAVNDVDDSPIIPAGQGFFVRTTTAGAPGTLRLTNANRVSTFGAQPSFGRDNDRRPVVRLTLRNAAGTSTDKLTLYADAAATAGVDARFDATKMSNPSGLNLSAVSATGETLAIDGRPAFAAGTAIALRLTVPTAGTYVLNARSVAYLPAGLVAYLHDSATGQQVNLSTQPTTSLTLAAGLSTRYSVVFAATGALASAPVLTAAQVALYPNPASQSASVSVTLPVTAGTRAARATVLNALGQVMSETTLAVQAGQASGTLRTTGLAAGVYVVRLQAGAEVVSKRLVID